MNPPARDAQEQRPGENPMVNKVSGYRQLTDAELALVNKIKALGPELERLHTEVVELVNDRSHAEMGHHDQHFRAAALGKTNLQQGAMWLIRAVAAPEGFI